ncbi:MAG: ABC transporter permease [Candidatus Sericytochromatia bacterium]|nr:ABC transporter permease [Candidatus Sericytochromatia bacterium]
MLRYVLKRFIQMIPLLLIISFVAFGIIRVAEVFANADPLAQLAMNPSITEETLNRERERLALDKPFLVRYTVWLKNFVTGNMGESYAYKAPVSTLIASRLSNTVILGLSTLIFTWLIALPLGIYLAVRQYSFIDQFFSSISYFFMGFPDFFLAIIFLLLAAVTGWFPIGGMTSTGYAEMSTMGKAINVGHHLILPTLTLSLISIASLQRRMRANMLDILGEEYIKTARAKGLSERKVIYKHAVRNAINPIITLLGFEIAGLISGAAFVEIIFNWPGLGNMMLQAVLGTDLNLVMAGLVISSFMLLLGNLIADLLLAAVDPRIKLEA